MTLSLTFVAIEYDLTIMQDFDTLHVRKTLGT